MIANDDSWVVNKLETSLTGDARVIIYNRRMFIVQATISNKHSCDLYYKTFMIVIYDCKIDNLAKAC